jgi:predicted NBD/HSP70 family sugar kinase
MTDRSHGATFDARSLLARNPADTFKENNRRKIIRSVMVTPDTQVNIARHTHLSAATVSTVVTDLERDGVFVIDSGDGERGKRVRLGPVRGVAVGVEVNHRNLVVAARPVNSSDIKFDSVGFDPDQAGNVWAQRAVRQIHETVRKTGLPADQIVSIGLGIPASIDPKTSQITQVSSSLGWNLTGDPRKQFQTHFPKVPVIVDNEANFATYGEYLHGAGHNSHETMLFVKASTGIGAGLVVGGLIYRGRQGIAGEIGHLTMEREGKFCRCGNRGCLETLIGGIPLLEQVREAYSGYRIDSPETLEIMIERAKSGDPVCRRVLEDAARVLGLAYAKVCNMINPELVVLGGELGAAADLLLPVIKENMYLYALRGMFEKSFSPVRLVGSELGRQAGAWGALSFALQVDELLTA